MDAIGSETRAGGEPSAAEGLTLRPSRRQRFIPLAHSKITSRSILFFPD